VKMRSPRESFSTSARLVPSRMIVRSAAWISAPVTWAGSAKVRAERSSALGWPYCWMARCRSPGVTACSSGRVSLRRFAWSGWTSGAKEMVRSDELPVGRAVMVWTHALPVEAMVSASSRPAMRLVVGSGDPAVGRLTMCHSPPGSCWSCRVGPVKGSKPHWPRIVPVRRIGLGSGAGGGVAGFFAASSGCAKAMESGSGSRMGSGSSTWCSGTCWRTRPPW